jgi:hypothetical protein
MGLRDLAKRTGLSLGAVQRAETGGAVQAVTLVKIRAVFEGEGFSYPDLKTVVFPDRLAKLTEDPPEPGSAE